MADDAKKFMAGIICFNKTSRQVISKVLRSHKNVEIEAPATQSESETLLQNATLDLIVIDQELQDCDVFAFIDNTQGKIEWEKCPKILLTSDSAEVSTAKASEYDFCGIIAKPFTQQTVSTVIDPIVQKYIDPAPDVVYLKEINMRIGKKQFKEAKEFFTANKCPKENFEVEFKKAIVFKELGETGEAKKILNVITQKNPNYLKGNILFSEVLKAESNFKDAYFYIKKAVELSPNNKDRIISATEIAVRSRNYLDLINYSKIVDQLGWDDKKILTYQVAALITQGQYLDKQQKLEEGFEAFNLGAKLGLRNETIRPLGVKSLLGAVKIKSNPEFEGLIAEYTKGKEKEDYAVLCKAFLDFHTKEYLKSSGGFSKFKDEKKWRDLCYVMIIRCWMGLEKVDKITRAIEDADMSGIKCEEYVLVKQQAQEVIAKLQNTQQKAAS